MFLSGNKAGTSNTPLAFPSIVYCFYIIVKIKIKRCCRLEIKLAHPIIPHWLFPLGMSCLAAELYPKLLRFSILADQGSPMRASTMRTRSAKTVPPGPAMGPSMVRAARKMEKVAKLRVSNWARSPLGGQPTPNRLKLKE